MRHTHTPPPSWDGDHNIDKRLTYTINVTTDPHLCQIGARVLKVEDGQILKKKYDENRKKCFAFKRNWQTAERPGREREREYQ